MPADLLEGPSRAGSGASNSAGNSEGSSFTSLDTVNGRKSAFASSEWMRPDKETVNRHGERIRVKERDREFKSELHKSFYDSTVSEINHMINIWENTLPDIDGGPDRLEELLGDPDYALYKFFKDRFTEVKEGSTTADGTPMLTLKEDALKRFLNTDRGLARAYELRKMRLEEIALNSGAFMDINLDQVPPQAIGNENSTTAAGGWAHELFVRRFGGWLGEPRERHGRRYRPRNILGINFGRRVDTVGAGALGSGLGAGAGAAIVGGILGGPVSLGAIGGAAVVPGLYSIYKSFQSGERISIDKAREALHIAQTDSHIKRDFAKLMWNVDVTNLGLDAQGRVGIRPGIEAGTELASPTMYFKAVESFLLQESTQIRAAEMAMSQRPEVLGAGMDRQGTGRRGSEQFTLGDIVTDVQVNKAVEEQLRDGPNGTGNPNMVPDPADPRPLAERPLVKNTVELFAAYGAAGYQFIDANGVQQNVTDAFNLATVTDEYRFRLRRTIFRRISAQKAEDSFQRILTAGKDFSSEFDQDTTDAMTAYGPESDASQARIRELVAAETLLTGEQTNLADSGTEITDYERFIETQHQELETSIDSIRAEEAKVTDIIDPATPIAPYNAPANVQEALRRMLNEPNCQFSIRIEGYDDVITSLGEQRRLLDQEIDNRYNAWLPTAQANLANLRARRLAAADDGLRNSLAAEIDTLQREIANKRKDLRENDLGHLSEPYDEQRKLVKDIVDSIRKSTRKSTDIRNELRNRREEHRRPVETRVNNMQAARSQIEGTAPVPANLAPDAYRTETFDELMTRINAQHAVDANFGWPPDQNNRNRMRLLNAMAQERAVFLEPRLSVPGANFDAAVNPAGYNFSEFDLVALTAQQIQDNITSRWPIPGVIGTVPNLATIEGVKEVANARLLARQRGLQEVQGQFRNRINTVTQELARVRENGIQPVHLEAIQQAKSRYADIGTYISNLTPQALGELFDTRPADTAVTTATGNQHVFLASEQEPGQSMAYARFMDVLFGHRRADQRTVAYDGQTGSDAAFRRNREFMSQDVLRDLLINRFNLVIPGGAHAAPPNFDDAVQALQARMNAGNISRTDLAGFFQQDVIYGYMKGLVPSRR